MMSGSGASGGAVAAGDAIHHLREQLHLRRRII
jgi:hypothetical protein